MATNETTADPIGALSDLIRAQYPQGMPVLRLSEARQGTVRYRYVDVVDYRIRFLADGRTIALVPDGRARRKYRSEAKAEREGEARAEREGKLYLGRCKIGTMDARTAERILSFLPV